mgnify:CR=1 FL=1
MFKTLNDNTLKYKTYLNKYVDLLILGVIVFTILGLLISIVGKRPTLSAYVFLLVTNLVLLPIIYFLNGGLDCGCVFWMLISITLPWVFLRGKHRVISGLISVVGVACCLAVSAIYPEIVQSRDNMNMLMAEYISSMIIVSCVYAVLFSNIIL